MTTRNLVRRLERLETRVAAATQEPLVFLIETVSSDGRIVDRFCFNTAGLRKLAPDEECPGAETARAKNESHQQSPAPA
jgi:hypothetical protein